LSPTLKASISSEESRGTYRFELRDCEIRALEVEWDRDFANAELEEILLHLAKEQEIEKRAREAALTMKDK
jgi:hypothetical protein